MEHPAQDPARHRPRVGVGQGLGDALPVREGTHRRSAGVPHETTDPGGRAVPRDIEWVKTFYPAGPDDDLAELIPFESQSFDLTAANRSTSWSSRPNTRWYEFGTFGTSDTVLVLFDKVEEGPDPLQGLRYRAADDDSGTDRNARFGAKLFKGRTYVLRMRLYWAGATGRAAVHDVVSPGRTVRRPRPAPLAIDPEAATRSHVLVCDPDVLLRRDGACEDGVATGVEAAVHELPLLGQRR